MFLNWCKIWVHLYRSDLNRQSGGPNEVIQIETLHHADRQKTEAYILELLLWLNYLVSQSKNNGANTRPSAKSPHPFPLKETDQSSMPKSPSSPSAISGIEDSEDTAVCKQRTTDSGNEQEAKL